jgi:hypothetical protein
MNEDLVEWLREQLDEDERIARAAADELEGPELGGEWRYDGRSVETVRERTMVAVGSQDLMELGVGRHIARHDPARVLREIEAKRRRLERHTPQMNIGVDSDENDPSTYVPACSICQTTVVNPGDWPCEELRDDAAVYADRPGYRAAWRP